MGVDVACVSLCVFRFVFLRAVCLRLTNFLSTFREDFRPTIENCKTAIRLVTKWSPWKA